MTSIDNCCGQVSLGATDVRKYANVCVDPVAVAYAKKLDSTLATGCNNAAQVTYSLAIILLASFLIYWK